MANKLMLTLLVTIILTVVLVATVNVGMSIFLEQPNYPDCYKDVQKPYPATYTTEEQAQIDLCNANYDTSIKHYNQTRFYILAGIGLVLVLLGLFIPLPVIRWTGLVSGLILLGESIVMNWQNKIAVFISLLIILVAIGIGGWRALK
jgi:hypothetical protein